MPATTAPAERTGERPPVSSPSPSSPSVSPPAPAPEAPRPPVEAPQDPPPLAVRAWRAVVEAAREAKEAGAALVEPTPGIRFDLAHAPASAAPSAPPAAPSAFSATTRADGSAAATTAREEAAAIAQRASAPTAKDGAADRTTAPPRVRAPEPCLTPCALPEATERATWTEPGPARAGVDALDAAPVSRAPRDAALFARMARATFGYLFP